MVFCARLHTPAAIYSTEVQKRVTTVVTVCSFSPGGWGAVLLGGTLPFDCCKMLLFCNTSASFQRVLAAVCSVEEALPSAKVFFSDTAVMSSLPKNIPNHLLKNGLFLFLSLHVCFVFFYGGCQPTFVKKAKHYPFSEVINHGRALTKVVELNTIHPVTTYYQLSDHKLMMLLPRVIFFFVFFTNVT